MSPPVAGNIINNDTSRRSSSSASSSSTPFATPPSSPMGPAAAASAQGAPPPPPPHPTRIPSRRTSSAYSATSGASFRGANLRSPSSSPVAAALRGEQPHPPNSTRTQWQRVPELITDAAASRPTAVDGGVGESAPSGTKHAGSATAAPDASPASRVPSRVPGLQRANGGASAVAGSSSGISRGPASTSPTAIGAAMKRTKSADGSTRGNTPLPSADAEAEAEAEPPLPSRTPRRQRSASSLPRLRSTIASSPRAPMPRLPSPHAATRSPPLPPSISVSQPTPSRPQLPPYRIRASPPSQTTSPTATTNSRRPLGAPRTPSSSNPNPNANAQRSLSSSKSQPSRINTIDLTDDAPGSLDDHIPPRPNGFNRRKSSGSTPSSAAGSRSSSRTSSPALPNSSSPSLQASTSSSRQRASPRLANGSPKLSGSPSSRTLGSSLPDDSGRSRLPRPGVGASDRAPSHTRPAPASSRIPEPRHATRPGIGIDTSYNEANATPSSPDTPRRPRGDSDATATPGASPQSSPNRRASGIPSLRTTTPRTRPGLTIPTPQTANRANRRISMPPPASKPSPPVPAKSPLRALGGGGGGSGGSGGVSRRSSSRSLASSPVPKSPVPPVPALPEELCLVPQGRKVRDGGTDVTEGREGTEAREESENWESGKLGVDGRSPVVGDHGLPGVRTPTSAPRRELPAVPVEEHADEAESHAAVLAGTQPASLTETRRDLPEATRPVDFTEEQPILPAQQPLPVDFETAQPAALTEEAQPVDFTQEAQPTVQIEESQSTVPDKVESQVIRTEEQPPARAPADAAEVDLTNADHRSAASPVASLASERSLASAPISEIDARSPVEESGYSAAALTPSPALALSSMALAPEVITESPAEEQASHALSSLTSMSSLSSQSSSLAPLSPNYASGRSLASDSLASTPSRSTTPNPTTPTPSASQSSTHTHTPHATTTHLPAQPQMSPRRASPPQLTSLSMPETNDFFSTPMRPRDSDADTSASTGDFPSPYSQDSAPPSAPASTVNLWAFKSAERDDSSQSSSPDSEKEAAKRDNREIEEILNDSAMYAAQKRSSSIRPQRTLAEPITPIGNKFNMHDKALPQTPHTPTTPGRPAERDPQMRSPSMPTLGARPPGTMPNDAIKSAATPLGSPNFPRSRTGPVNSNAGGLQPAPVLASRPQSMIVSTPSSATPSPSLSRRAHLIREIAHTERSHATDLALIRDAYLGYVLRPTSQHSQGTVGSASIVNSLGEYADSSTTTTPTTPAQESRHSRRSSSYGIPEEGQRHSGYERNSGYERTSGYHVEKLESRSSHDSAKRGSGHERRMSGHDSWATAWNGLMSPTLKSAREEKENGGSLDSLYDGSSGAASSSSLQMASPLMPSPRIPSTPSSTNGFGRASAPPGRPLSTQDIRTVFINIAQLAQLAGELATQFENALGSPEDEVASPGGEGGSDRIGEVFSRSLHRLRPLYMQYCSRHGVAHQRLMELQADPQSAAYLNDCWLKVKAHTHAWNLDSMLIKPIQRITKYPLLFEDLLACTTPVHPDYYAIRAAAEGARALAHDIDETKRRKDVISSVMGKSTSTISLIKEPKTQGSGGRLLGLRRFMKDKSLGGGSNDPLAPLDISPYAQSQLKDLVSRLQQNRDNVQRLGVQMLEWSQATKDMMLADMEMNKDVIKWHSLRSRITNDSRLEKVAAYQGVLNAIVHESWGEMNDKIENSVLLIMSKLLDSTKNPLIIVDKLNGKASEYARYVAHRHAKKNIERVLMQEATEYVSIHTQLLEELPAFLEGWKRVFELGMLAFADAQTEYYAAVRDRVTVFAAQYLSEPLEEVTRGDGILIVPLNVSTSRGLHKAWHDAWREPNADMRSLEITGGDGSRNGTGVLRSTARFADNNNWERSPNLSAPDLPSETSSMHHLAPPGSDDSGSGSSRPGGRRRSMSLMAPPQSTLPLSEQGHLDVPRHDVPARPDSASGRSVAGLFRRGSHRGEGKKSRNNSKDESHSATSLIGKVFPHSDSRSSTPGPGPHSNNVSSTSLAYEPEPRQAIERARTPSGSTMDSEASEDDHSRHSFGLPRIPLDDDQFLDGISVSPLDMTFSALGLGLDGRDTPPQAASPVSSLGPSPLHQSTSSFSPLQEVRSIESYSTPPAPQVVLQAATPAVPQGAAFPPSRSPVPAPQVPFPAPQSPPVASVPQMRQLTPEPVHSTQPAQRTPQAPHATLAAPEARSVSPASPRAAPPPWAALQATPKPPVREITPSPSPVAPPTSLQPATSPPAAVHSPIPSAPTNAAFAAAPAPAVPTPAQDQDAGETWRASRVMYACTVVADFDPAEVGNKKFKGLSFLPIAPGDLVDVYHEIGRVSDLPDFPYAHVGVENDGAVVCRAGNGRIGVAMCSFLEPLR